jgi:hypothetical protein|tara:strand:+ start:656 stop:1087 length:432 start_codon:yes stop_codon:yes gene_type:complete
MKNEITNRGQLLLNHCLPIVCSFFVVKPKDVLSKLKNKKFVDARHALRYYMAKSEELSFAEIASLTNADHASVSYSVKKFKRNKQTYDKFKKFEKYLNSKTFRFTNSITQLDKELRKSIAYSSLPLSAKADFIKKFIEQNGYK